MPHNSGPSCIIHDCLASSSSRVIQQKRVHSDQSETLPQPVPAVTFSVYAPPVWPILLGREVITEMAKMLKLWLSVHATELARMRRIGSSENPAYKEPTVQCVRVCGHVKQESMAVHKVLHEHEGRVCSAWCAGVLQGRYLAWEGGQNEELYCHSRLEWMSV